MAQLLPFNAQGMDDRIKARITRFEFISLTLNLVLVLITLWLHSSVYRIDLINYLKISHGDFSNYYYAYWLVPIFATLGKLPILPVFLAISAGNFIAVFYASRVFGIKIPWVLMSYQLIHLIYYGSITGFLVGGLALMIWGITHKRWYLAGFGLLIACSKPQVGATYGLLLWLFSSMSWRDRLKTLAMPVAGVLISLVIYPGWPLELLRTYQISPVNDWSSLSPWRWLGPAVLLVLIPPLALPLSKEQRLMAFAAAIPMALPYFQQADLVALFTLPVGWLPLLGNLGYISILTDYPVLQWMFILPLALYLYILLPSFWRWLKSLSQANRLPSKA